MNEPKLSQRSAAVRPSATLQMAARASALRDSGVRVFDFSAGEPDFLPPQAVREGAMAYARDRAVRYTAVGGMPALREVVASHLAAYHGRPIAPAEVLISCGAKHSIINYMLATLDPGDEVLFPIPSWVSYPDMTRLVGAVPVAVPTSAADNFRLQPEALAAALTPRTRLVILNSPGNPTGIGYDFELLQGLGEVLARRAPQAYLMADDLYRQLTYPPFEHTSFVRALADLTDRVILVDGVSKAYAMTGYRIGFLVGPAQVVAAATRIQGQVTSSPPTLSQHAAWVALTDPTVPDQVRAMAAAFARRRQKVLSELGRIPKLGITEPQGAFYVWLDVSAYLHAGARGRVPPSGPAGLVGDTALANWLLEHHHVAAVAGSAFGTPGYLRLSYATDDESLAAGCSALATAFAELAAADSSGAP